MASFNWQINSNLKFIISKYFPSHSFLARPLKFPHSLLNKLIVTNIYPATLMLIDYHFGITNVFIHYWNYQMFGKSFETSSNFNFSIKHYFKY